MLLLLVLLLLLLLLIMMLLLVVGCSTNMRFYGSYRRRRRWLDISLGKVDAKDFSAVYQVTKSRAGIIENIVDHNKYRVSHSREIARDESDEW